jgi:hypothetical protein
MASRYFVGTGTWNASLTTNWASSSGGAGGASVPTSTDDVFIDGLSGTSTVITTSGTISCLSLNFTGAITPTFAGNGTLSVFGNLTRIAAMTWTFNGTFKFVATSTGKTIACAGGSWAAGILFAGVGGGWTLQDALNATSQGITLTNGAITSGNFPINCSSFTSNNAATRSLTLGASIFTCANWLCDTVTGFTFSGASSSIVLSGTDFYGGGLTYGTVTSNSTNLTIRDSNTIGNIIINAGKTLKLVSGTTQAATTFASNGTLANPSTLQAVTGGSAATVSLPAGRYFMRHTSCKDITISGATSMTDIAGTNTSGNTGITFVTKFEMGRIKNDGSFNWYSSATGASAKVSG